MPGTKMTRIEFFEFYKNIVSQFDDKYAAEWLNNASRITENDFIDADEDIDIDIEELIGSNIGSRAKYSQIIEKLGLKPEKSALVSETHDEAEIDEFVKNTFGKIGEIAEAGKAEELKRDGKAASVFGWTDAIYNEIDTIVLYSKDQEDFKRDLPLTFFVKNDAGENEQLKVGEVDKALAEGSVVYARHGAFGDIPMLKSGKNILTGLKIDSYRPEEQIKVKQTRIPEVKGFINTICKWLNIRTAGTAPYFDALDLQKRREEEYRSKCAEFIKAKRSIESNTLYKDALDAKVKYVKMDSGDIQIEYGIKKTNDLRMEPENIQKNNQRKKLNASVYKDNSNELSDELKTKLQDELGDEHEKFEFYERYGYNDTALRLNDLKNVAYGLEKGHMIYAVPYNVNNDGNMPLKDIQEKAIRIYASREDRTLQFGEDAENVKKADDANYKHEAFLQKMNAPVNDMLDTFEYLSLHANGNTPIQQGEDTEKWKDKAYYNLRTQPKPTAADLDEWLNNNREQIISNYKEKNPDNADKKTIDWLEKLNGTILMPFMDNKRKIKLVNEYFTAGREKLTSAKINANKEKQDVVLNDCQKGQKIVDEMRKKAYITLMDGDCVDKPLNIFNALAVITACRNIYDKPNAVKTKEFENIGKNPEILKKYANEVKTKPVFKYLREEYMNKNIKSDTYLIEERKKLALNGFAEFAPLSDKDPVSGADYEKKLAERFNVTNIMANKRIKQNGREFGLNERIENDRIKAEKDLGALGN